MKIWLDDSRPAPEGWIWVKHPNDIFRYLVNEEVEEISFDHDLGLIRGDIEITGYTALVAIERHLAFGTIRKPKKLSIHSANAGARRKMELAIQSIEKM